MKRSMRGLVLQQIKLSVVYMSCLHTFILAVTMVTVYFRVALYNVCLHVVCLITKKENGTLNLLTRQNVPV